MSVTELAPPPGLEELRARYRAFMEEHVYPERGRDLDARTTPRSSSSTSLPAAREGRRAVGAAPPAGGGRDRPGFLAYAYLNEEIGRSTWAQYIFGCQAPDAGNGEIL